MAAARKCPECGRPAKPDHRYCGDCGKALFLQPTEGPLVCTDCGATVEEENRFCTNCGAKFED